MRTLIALIVGAGMLLPAPTLFGQTIAGRVAAVRDGKVRMSFTARAGVCGNGHNISIDGHTHITTRDDDDDWETDCEPGPVRVQLRIGDSEITDVDMYVGGRWRSAGESTIDLGTVPAAEAADYLLDVARGHDDVGGEALFAASLADGGVLWPELLEMAKDESLPRDTRSTALLVLGQEAAEAATEGLTEIIYDDEGDREVREMAVFALSQRPADEAVPILIRIVRTNEDPELVRSALFWLGQSGDPRAIKLYEEILTGG
jgi:hypothetical protein